MNLKLYATFILLKKLGKILSKNILLQNPSTKKKTNSLNMAALITENSIIFAVLWNDNNVVHMISTYAGVEPQDYVQRWDRKTKKCITITRPFAVTEYNKFMGGVDMSDQLIYFNINSNSSLYEASDKPQTEILEFVQV
uniref:DDE_Tnp_1_7 domain-containing protein n=1 Tax=Glossina pallidipes TaxID=7398 RepID=A0A1B0AA25_GLOPL